MALVVPGSGFVKFLTSHHLIFVRFLLYLAIGLVQNKVTHALRAEDPDTENTLCDMMDLIQMTLDDADDVQKEVEKAEKAKEEVKKAEKAKVEAKEAKEAEEAKEETGEEAEKEKEAREAEKAKKETDEAERTLYVHLVQFAMIPAVKLKHYYM